MSERKIRVRLEAQIAGYKTAMGDARKEAEKTAATIDRDGKKIETAAGRMVRSAEVNREAWQTAGTSLVAFGATGVVTMGAAAKAALDWESAFAGVLKTVDEGALSYGQLEEQLRAMATELPASHREIAGVAEAAGQLGVSIENVSAFTRVMINLGETTNLTAEEAATALARISNIMGTAAGDVGRMGSTIVALGNNSATTEAEIVELATRLAAAGKQAGLSEADIFAFSSALTSVGVPAEAAGTAISKVMTSIGDAVRDGGKDLETYAQVAGVSVEQFRAAFEEDAAGAISMFIEGMGRMSASGESTTAVFDELGLADERLKRSVLSLGSATGLLGEQLELASTAWKDNTALIEEANKRYETTEAKIQIAKNAMTEAGIVIGEYLLPVLASLAEGVANVATWFANLPGPIQGAITGLGGVLTAASLAAGGFLLLFPRIMDARAAFQTLRTISPRTVAGIGAVSKAAARAAGAFIATTAAVHAFNESTIETAPGAGEATKAMLELADGISFADSALSHMIERGGFADTFNNNDIDSIERAVERITNSSWDEKLADAINTPFGSKSAGLEQAREVIEAIDTGLTSLVQSGAIDEADKALANMADEAGVSVEEMLELLPGYSDALAQVDAEQQLAASSAGASADAWDEAGISAEGLAMSLEEVIDAQREAAGIALSAREATRQYEQALDDARATLEENGATMDINTQKGRDNQAAVDDLASAIWDEIDAMEANGVSAVELKTKMEQSRAEFIKTAKQAGLTAEEAEALADELNLIPGNVASTVSIDTSGAWASLNSLQTKINNVSGKHIALGYGSISTFSSNRKAGGGPIVGPGTGTSDDVPIWASNGEYMQTYAAHRFWGTDGMDAIRDMDVERLWQTMSAKGHASGGSISDVYMRPSMPVGAPAAIGPVSASLSRADADYIVSGVLRGAARIASGEIDRTGSDLEMRPR